MNDTPPFRTPLIWTKRLVVTVYAAAVLAAGGAWWVAGDLDLVSFLFRLVAVPALITAAALGVMLWMLRPGHFLRARWWQVKMGLLALGIPAGHWLVAGAVRAARARPGPETESSLTLALLGLILGSAAVIALAGFRPGKAISNTVRQTPEGDA
ncbi:MAG: hypothetical protein R3336_02505 [Phycisphaeraceae bacterium]|nr:hypothetical protein [Phycisphaeraceae bacterium]